MHCKRDIVGFIFVALVFFGGNTAVSAADSCPDPDTCVPTFFQNLEPMTPGLRHNGVPGPTTQVDPELRGGFHVTPSGLPTYSLPISVPPGRNGVQPDLNLVYDGSTSEGVFGVGFKLSGVSSIQRCQVAPTHEYANGLPKYKSSPSQAYDDYCLDGQPMLVAAIGPNGEPVEYGVPNSTAKITPDSWNGSNTHGFTIEDGKGFTTRLERVGAQKVFYQVSRTDPWDNRVDYIYSYFSNGVWGRLDSIKYTSTGSQAGTREVRFRYTQRIHPVRRFRDGVDDSRDAVVNKIEMFVHNTEAWRYEIDYQPGDWQKKVASVRQCAESQCSVPVRFKWSNDSAPELFDQSQLRFNTNPQNPSSGLDIVVDRSISQADFDGDGMDDFLVVGEPRTKFIVNQPGQEPKQGWYLYLSGDPTPYLTAHRVEFSFDDGSGPQTLPFKPYDLSAPEEQFHAAESLRGDVIKLLDYNLDGKMDFVRSLHPEETDSRLYVYVSNGTGTFTKTDAGFWAETMRGAFDVPANWAKTYWEFTQSGDYGVGVQANIFDRSLFIDFNGDGAQDLVYCDVGTDGLPTWQMRLHTGSGFGVSRETNVDCRATDTSNSPWTLIDLNGDGAVEILQKDDGNLNLISYDPLQPDGVIVEAMAIEWETEHIHLPIYFNHDRNQDLIVLDPSTFLVTVYVSDGFRLIESKSFGFDDDWANLDLAASRVLMGAAFAFDWNADGRQDLVFPSRQVKDGPCHLEAPTQAPAGSYGRDAGIGRTSFARYVSGCHFGMIEWRAWLSDDDPRPEDSVATGLLTKSDRMERNEYLHAKYLDTSRRWIPLDLHYVEGEFVTTCIETVCSLEMACLDAFGPVECEVCEDHQAYGCEPDIRDMENSAPIIVRPSIINHNTSEFVWMSLESEDECELNSYEGNYDLVVNGNSYTLPFEVLLWDGCGYTANFHHFTKNSRPRIEEIHERLDSELYDRPSVSIKWKPESDVTQTSEFASDSCVFPKSCDPESARLVVGEYSTFQGHKLPRLTHKFTYFDPETELTGKSVNRFSATIRHTFYDSVDTDGDGYADVPARDVGFQGRKWSRHPVLLNQSDFRYSNFETLTWSFRAETDMVFHWNRESRDVVHEWDFRGMPFHSQITVDTTSGIVDLSNQSGSLEEILIERLGLTTNPTGILLGPELSRSTTQTSWDNFQNTIFRGTQVFDPFGIEINHQYVSTSYAPQLGAYLLGLPFASTQTSQVADSNGVVDTKQKTTNFEFEQSDPNNLHRLNTVISDDGVCQRVDLSYDQFGNKKTTTKSGCSLEGFEFTSFEYESEGYFLESVTNDLGHTTMFSHDARHGRTTLQRDPNGITNSFSHDAFGRIQEHVHPDLRVTSYLSEHVYSPAIGPLVKTHVATTGGAETISLLDSRGRPWVNLSSIDDLWWRRVDYRYDQYLGVKSGWSKPVVLGTTPSDFTSLEFDWLGRKVKETHPSGREIGIDYQADVEGLVVQTTEPNGGTSQMRYRRDGVLLSKTDAMGGRNIYDYGAFGQLRAVTDADGHTSNYTYDPGGRVLTAFEPNTGQTQNSYDARGRLAMTSRGTSHSMSFEYDEIGRVVALTDHDNNVQTFVYDNAVGASIGRVARTTSFDGVEVIHEYDALGRPATNTTNIGTDSYEVSVAYDTYGNVAAVTYPQSAAIAPQLVYSYDGIGNLNSVEDDTGFNIWRTDSARNVLGAAPSYTMNNDAISVQRSWDPVSLEPTGLSATAEVGTTTVQLEDFTVKRNSAGDVSERNDYVRGQFEYFDYDLLHRLVGQSICSDYPCDAPPDLELEYSAAGNIEYKSDVGTYTYGSQPNAVTDIDGLRYRYDTLGRQIERPGWTIGWNSIHKPKWMTSDNGDHIEFLYDSAGNRVRQITSDGVQTTTIGAFTEVDSSTGTDISIAVVAEGVSVADVRFNNGTRSRVFRTQDNLGSPSSTLDESNTIVSELSFSPFGVSRDPYDWTTALAGQFSAVQDEGFTGHRTVSSFGLAITDMNARFYDPATGRFLSADSVVPSPTSTQAFNRYSYVYNSPLNWTDPSGNVPCDGGCEDALFVEVDVIAAAEAIGEFFSGDGGSGKSGGDFFEPNFDISFGLDYEFEPVESIFGDGNNARNKETGQHKTNKTAEVSNLDFIGDFGKEAAVGAGKESVKDAAFTLCAAGTRFGCLPQELLNSKHIAPHFQAENAAQKWGGQAYIGAAALSPTPMGKSHFVRKFSLGLKERLLALHADEAGHILIGGRRSGILDNGVLVAAADPSHFMHSTASNVLNSLDYRLITPNQLREFLHFRGISSSQLASRKRFLAENGVSLLDGRSLANSSEFQRVFQRVSGYHGRADGALIGAANALGIPAYTLDGRLYKFVRKTISDPSIAAPYLLTP